MKPLLSVQELRTTFDVGGRVVRAVDGVSFDLFEGETLGIVGESGCGKTVMALSILKLIERPGTIAETSRIVFDTRDLLTLSPAELRRVRGAKIAMVFQEPTTSLNPVLTVGTQIGETLRAHRGVDRRRAKARAVELLDMVGIPDSRDRVDSYPHELSGGMQQRVMIAMALACEPRMLIADEPTTALDVTVQAQILDLLSELSQELGMALLLISHDLGIVAGLADRIGVMYAGQLVEEAPTLELFEQPQHPYTEALLQAVPRLDRVGKRLPAIPGSVPRASAWPEGCRFHPRCPYAWDRCRTRMPGLCESSARRGVRCWLLDEPERRQS
jgi:oligopeptide/dipeptide ABC transporter ATP-binding protein